MQIIRHKKTDLTISQKFFIEKSIELLYFGTIDSYRVKLNNPKTILEELRYCLNEFEAGRIKHFHTIKAKEANKKGLVDEAIKLLSDKDENQLVFRSVSKDYILTSLKELNENNYKKIASILEILLKENPMYLNKLIDEVKNLLDANISDFDHLIKIDKILAKLFSELINKGFSKGFLYKIFYGIFVNSLKQTSSFDAFFDNFKLRILSDECEHLVVFRVDTTQKVYDSVNSINYENNKIDG